MDQDDNKWVGTDFGGLVKISGNTMQIFSSDPQRHPDAWITSLALDKQQNLWIGGLF
ncbi:MAG: hypothetical protein IPL98_02460 [Saprospiraceae bacterium]|nr:hypothetical protein [Saprospiraceae bacterium]